MMEQWVILFGLLSFFGLVWSFVNGIRIGKYLEKNNIPVNWWLFRFLIFKYVMKYKEITTQEGGKPGPLYYRFNYSVTFFVISISITLLTLILWRK